MQFTKAVVIAGATLPCGCMTTAGRVTGPVTSIGSVAWHTSDEELDPMTQGREGVPEDGGSTP